MILMYYAKKMHLFNYCKRPIPCDNTVNDFMYHFISVGPLLFVIGNILFSIRSQYPHPMEYAFNWINILSLIVALTLIILLRFSRITRYNSSKESRDS